MKRIAQEKGMTREKGPETGRKPWGRDRSPNSSNKQLYKLEQIH